MSTINKFGISLGLLACLVLAGWVRAADSPAADSPSSIRPGPTAPTASGDISMHGQHKAAGWLRATKLLGMEVKDPAGASLGSISDLVLSPDKGELRYAVVASGGFLGIGESLIPVPWKALRLQRDASSNTDFWMLDVDNARFAKAPRIDPANWPDFADTQYTSQLDAFFGVEPAAAPQTPSPSTEPAPSPNEKKPAPSTESAPAPAEKPAPTEHRHGSEAPPAMSR